MPRSPVTGNRSGDWSGQAAADAMGPPKNHGPEGHQKSGALGLLNSIPTTCLTGSNASRTLLDHGAKVEEGASLLPRPRLPPTRRCSGPALQFALATGARRGEILALKWELVDFLQERIEIRRTVNPSGKETKKVKTSERRFTPLEASLSAMLINLHSSELSSADSDWVFPSPRGLLWQERNFARAWYRLRHRAKKAGVRPLPFHCTRHTFITWALEAGTPVKRVSEWVGASVSVIEQTYAHVMPQVAPDLSFAGMGRKWGGLGRITPFSDIEEERKVSDDERESSGDPGAIRTRDPQLRRLFRESCNLPALLRYSENLVRSRSAMRCQEVP
jgi:hypothetical protein